MNNSFTSTVIKGKGRGQRIGFSTLNLSIPSALTARHGVYAGWVIVDGHRYPGAFHFGAIPTFQDQDLSLEVYVLDITFSPVPQSINFLLVKYLRPIKTFTNPQALAHQITLDVQQVEHSLAPASSACINC